MYPSSSSSSSHGSMGPSGLTRYGSAPGSFLTAAVDSITRDFSAFGSQQPRFLHPPYFSSSAADTSSLTAESTCKANHPPGPKHPYNSTSTTNNTTQSRQPYGLNGIASAVGGDFATARAGINLNSKSGGGGSLVRHSSSPAGFLDHLNVYANASSTPTAAATNGNGFPVTRAMGGYNSKAGLSVSDSGHGISRLTSQLSFTRQDSLSHISEENDQNGRRKSAHSYATASFGMGSWDDSNEIVFSDSPSKRAKRMGGDVIRCLNTAESEFEFSLSQTDPEMVTTEKFGQIPQDSVACRIRAKRGFATHPRSIAERDRRTRINGKLKKLQDLVPNLEKQTSYADMLDLAVQHIRGLENEIQKLKKEVKNCTCGCNQTTGG